MGFFSKLFGKGQPASRDYSLPDSWDDVASFWLVIPFRSRTATALIGAGNEALKIRNALEGLCIEKYFPDPTYNDILKKELCGGGLTGEEAQYKKNRKRNTGRLLAEKFKLVFLYEGDFNALSPKERQQLRDAVSSFPDADFCGFGQQELLVGSALQHLSAQTEGKLVYLYPGQTIPERSPEKVINLILGTEEREFRVSELA